MSALTRGTVQIALSFGARLGASIYTVPRVSADKFFVLHLPRRVAQVRLRSLSGDEAAQACRAAIHLPILVQKEQRLPFEPSKPIGMHRQLVVSKSSCGWIRAV